MDIKQGKGNNLGSFVEKAEITHKNKFQKYSGWFIPEKLEDESKEVTQETALCDLDEEVQGRMEILKETMKKDPNLAPHGGNVDISLGTSATALISGLVFKSPGPAAGVLLGNFYRAYASHEGGELDLRKPVKSKISYFPSKSEN